MGHKTLRVKRSALLLVFLGALFSIPLATKTMSAHGLLPALVTGLLVIAAVFLGPVSYIVAGAASSSLTIVANSATGTEFVLALVLGVILFLVWLNLLSRRSTQSIPYLPLTGWALMGVYFCLSRVFPHIT